jgi:integrase
LAPKKQSSVTLPEGVDKIVVNRKNGKSYTYFYFTPGRGSENEGDRVPMPNPESSPKRFWIEFDRLTKVEKEKRKPKLSKVGAVCSLIEKYRASDEFKRLSDGTRTNYEVHMRRFEDPEKTGMVKVRGMTPQAVMSARDSMKDTPVMANQMLAVGRAIWDFAIPLDLATMNPFDKVRDLDVPDRGHVPWPSWAVDYVKMHAWPDLVRMVKLGVMTCQRGSDMVKMGPAFREGNGIWCRPKKTRTRRRSFHIPLSTADALELDRWVETPLTFTNSRWTKAKAIERHRDDLYLYSSTNSPYTPDSLRSRYGRWLSETEEGKVLSKRWKDWVSGMVKKYDWDIDPEDADHPTIHGLRGTGILLRSELGYTVDQIGNDIGMSRQNVDHYMRFRDQMKVGFDNQTRLRVVGNSNTKGD